MLCEWQRIQCRGDAETRGQQSLRLELHMYDVQRYVSTLALMILTISDWFKFNVH